MLCMTYKLQQSFLYRMNVSCVSYLSFWKICIKLQDLWDGLPRHGGFVQSPLLSKNISPKQPCMSTTMDSQSSICGMCNLATETWHVSFLFVNWRLWMVERKQWRFLVYLKILFCSRSDEGGSKLWSSDHSFFYCVEKLISWQPNLNFKTKWWR